MPATNQGSFGRENDMSDDINGEQIMIFINNKKDATERRLRELLITTPNNSDEVIDETMQIIGKQSILNDIKAYVLGELISNRRSIEGKTI